MVKGMFFKMKVKSNKQLLGQYFTKRNIFDCPEFMEWLKIVGERLNRPVLEPFAGGKDIPRLLSESISSWKCFDIEPTSSDIEYRDTLKDFPTEYEVCITNPPFLKLKKDNRKYSDYDNLYKISLVKILENTGYAAVVLPINFMITPLFRSVRSRIFAVFYPDYEVCECTKQPVVLVHFIPEAKKKEISGQYELNDNNDFLVNKSNKQKRYSEYEKAGAFISDIAFEDIFYFYRDYVDNEKLVNMSKESILFIRCIDSDKEKIRIMDLNDKEVLKHVEKYTYKSTRAFNFILIKIDAEYIPELIRISNELLNEYRKAVDDIFLSAWFDNIRKCINNNTIKKILQAALNIMELENRQIA